jgi:hypothetical protein
VDRDVPQKGEESSRSALARLLEAEERLEARLEDAEREARRLVAEAVLRAEEQLAGLGAELEAARFTIESRLREARAHRLAELERAAGTALERFTRLGDPEIDHQARWVVDRILGDARGAP